MTDMIEGSRRQFLAGSAAAVTAGVLAPRVAHAEAPVPLADLLLIPESAEALSKRIARRLKPEREALMKRYARWAELFPNTLKRTIASADEGLAGMLTLDGTAGKPMFVGNPPRWLDNPTPTVDFTSMLNRMPHWKPMLTAWAVTGKRAYAEKVAQEIDSWVDQVPLKAIDPAAKGSWRVDQPWRTIETGIRMGGEVWPLALRMLAGTEFMPADRLERMVRAMHHHGRALATISPLNAPKATGNWLTFEMTGLLHLSTVLPELKEAAAWKALGWERIERNCKVSMKLSGGQEEGAPHYSNICVSHFSSAARIGRASGLTPSPDFRARVAAGARYALYSSRPSGDNVPWADSDTGPTPADAIVASSASIDDWDAVPAYKRMAGKAKLDAAAAKIYLQIDDADAWLTKLRAIEPATTTRSFWAKELDQGMLRTGWSDKASSLFFACRTPNDYGHSHQDPAGFDYCALGRPLLVDPGRYTYLDGVDRRRFKSATAHNTITVNDREPMAFVSNFKLGPQKEGRLVAHHKGDGFEAFEAINRNFEPVTHRRVAILTYRGDLIVVDYLDGLAPGDRVQSWMHFDSVKVAWDAARRSAVTADEGKPNARLTVSAGLAGRTLPGFVSDRMDHRRPSTRLRLETTGTEPTRVFAAHVQPFVGEAVSSAVSVTKSGDDAWRIDLGAAGEHHLVWRPGASLTGSVVPKQSA